MSRIFMVHSTYLKMAPWTQQAPAQLYPERQPHGGPLYVSIPLFFYHWLLNILQNLIYLPAVGLNEHSNLFCIKKIAMVSMTLIF